MNDDQTPIDENDSETMAQVLAESGEPVAPASETPTRHDNARKILQRFISSHFNNAGEKPRISIPADFERDDDLQILHYIDENESLETRARDAEARVAALESERATSIEHTGKLLAASDAGAAALRQALTKVQVQCFADSTPTDLSRMLDSIVQSALDTDAGAATLKRIELLESENGSVKRIAMERNQFEKEAKDARAKLAEAEVAKACAVREVQECHAIEVNSYLSELDELRAKLTDARALADGMGEDKARLDWLEETTNLHGQYVRLSVSNSRDIGYKDGSGPVSFTIHKGNDGINGKGDNLRQSIDAAIAAWKGAK